MIVNEDLDRGTQLPFIERAMKEGYAVVVANTNDNSRTFGSRKQLIQVFTIDNNESLNTD